MKAWAPALLASLALAGLDDAVAGESVGYLYRLHCSGCHGTEGEGSKIGRIPPFAGIVGHFTASPRGRLYLVHVPGVANAALQDRETADVLNYVLRKWAISDMPKDISDFSAEEVHTLRDIHVDDIAALRHRLAHELAGRGISINY